MTAATDSNAPPVSERFIPFRDFSIWSRMAGDGEVPGKLPLLVLHGGPGLPSDYLFPLDALAEGRRVLYYDQLGAGRSDQPRDPALWSVDLFLEELSVVRRTLGLDRIHLFGHSWGGMLALEHALTGAPGIASLILADVPADVPAWNREIEALVELMPEPHRRLLRQGIQTGQWEGEAVEAALRAFNERHLLRRRDEAARLGVSLHEPGVAPEVYTVMVGLNELATTGLLRDWDVSHRLGEIGVPTLVIGGRYDQTTPLLTAALHRGIPWSEVAIFEESAHFPHLEEHARFVALLADFLTRVEAYL